MITIYQNKIEKTVQVEQDFKALQIESAYDLVQFIQDQTGHTHIQLTIEEV